MIQLEGLLVVDKPAGPTSHDIVEQVRRFAGRLRVGHTGTLDPFATGVLALCLGRATRLSRFLAAARKVYRGTIRLGISTDTYDLQGRVVRQGLLSGIDESVVRDAASRFTGPLMQTPPPYSARKVSGRASHRLARQGRPVALKPSPVTVFRLDILEVSEALVRFEAETSSGTYIRSLAHDLGAALGCGAHLAELRRLASGSLHIGQAHPLDDVLERGRLDRLAEIIMPLRRIDLGLPTVTVTRDGLVAMRAGRPLLLRDFSRPEPEGSGSGLGAGDGSVRVQDESGNLLGVAVRGSDPLGAEVLQPAVVLVA